MRFLILTVCVLLIAASPAMAHCGKAHPESKDKTQDSRPTKKPE